MEEALVMLFFLVSHASECIFVHFYLKVKVKVMEHFNEYHANGKGRTNITTAIKYGTAYGLSINIFTFDLCPF